MRDPRGAPSTTEASDTAACDAPMLSVAAVLANPIHGGSINGATRIGSAVGNEHLLIRLGVWRNAAGLIKRARFQCSTCASLIAYAELACRILERNADVKTLDASLLRSSLEGVHPGRYDRAELVARAMQMALTDAEGQPEEASQ